MSMPSRTARLILALRKRQQRWWFLPTISLFPLTDYVLPFLPNQMLLVVLSILSPNRWLQFALSFVIATGLGALLTALAIQAIGPQILDTLFGGAPAGDNVTRIQALVLDYGLIALVPLAMLPWPPRSAVLVCALAGLAPLGIGVAVMAGRLVPAFGYALVGAKAPALLRRNRKVDQLLTEVETLIGC